MLLLHLGFASLQQLQECGVAGVTQAALSAATFIGMAGTLYLQGFDGLAFILGWTGGYCLVALLIAPYLRKFGQFTIPDFLGARYGGNVARGIGIMAATAPNPNQPGVHVVQVRVDVGDLTLERKGDRSHHHNDDSKPSKKRPPQEFQRSQSSMILIYIIWSRG